MCLIYYRDSAKHTGKINWQALASAYKSNPDGTGISWYNVKLGQWQVWRSISASWKQCRKRIAALDALPNVSRLAVHFRFATHGGGTLENCHPFHVSGDSYFFHNGIFSGIDTNEHDHSDSRQVASAMARLVSNGAKLRDAWRPIKLLAGSNRLLLTLPGGKVAYAGQWTSKPDGCYSNSNCFPMPVYRYTYNGKVTSDDCGLSRKLAGFSQGRLPGYGSASDNYDSNLLPSKYRPTKSAIQTIYDKYEDSYYVQDDEQYMSELAQRFRDTIVDDDTQIEST